MDGLNGWEAAQLIGIVVLVLGGSVVGTFVGLGLVPKRLRREEERKEQDGR